MSKILVCAGARGRCETDQIEATVLGCALGMAGHCVVTGGGHGLMDNVAQGCMSVGGDAAGITLTSIAERRLPPMEYVVYQRDTLFQRKQEMLALCDAAVVIPGGVGTLDEFFELLCAKKLGHWVGTVVLFNLRGYYDALLEQLEQCRFDGYLTGEPLFQVAETVDDVVVKLRPARASEDRDE